MPINSVEEAVTKHLTVSTRHLCMNALKYLELEQDTAMDYYKMDEYGWFVYLAFAKTELLRDIPVSLLTFFVLAKEQGCNLLILDTEADILEDYPVYR